MSIANIAVPENLKYKVLVWGGPSTGKTKFSLSAPEPLAIDLENSTSRYSKDFKFYKATIDISNKSINNACNLTLEIIKEIANGTYENKVKTLIIDPVSDLMDNLESIICESFQKQLGRNIESLNQLQKAKWYAYKKKKTRSLLDKIISLDVNIIFIAREKLVWGKTSEGMQPIGKIYDCPELLEYLVEVVINTRKDLPMLVTKSRVDTIKQGELEGYKWDDIFKDKELKLVKTS